MRGKGVAAAEIGILIIARNDDIVRSQRQRAVVGQEPGSRVAPEIQRRARIGQDRSSRSRNRLRRQRASCDVHQPRIGDRRADAADIVTDQLARIGETVRRERRVIHERQPRIAEIAAARDNGEVAVMQGKDARCGNASQSLVDRNRRAAAKRCHFEHRSCTFKDHFSRWAARRANGRDQVGRVRTQVDRAGAAIALRINPPAIKDAATLQIEIIGITVEHDCAVGIGKEFAAKACTVIFVKTAFKRKGAAVNRRNHAAVEKARIAARAKTVARANSAAAACRVDADAGARACVGGNVATIGHVRIIDTDIAGTTDRQSGTENILAAIAIDIGDIAAVIEDDRPRSTDRQRAARALFVEQLRAIRNLQRSVVDEARVQIKIVGFLVDNTARRQRDVGQILRLVIRLDDARRVRRQCTAQYPRVAVEVDRRAAQCADDGSRGIFIQAAFKRDRAAADGFDDAVVEQPRIIARPHTITANAAAAARSID